MCAEHDGKRFSEQLVEAGVQIGWPTRLVSFGPDITAAVFAMGFACRVAMAFGGIKPGDFRKNLIYNKDRTFAFVMPLGYVTDEWYANAAGQLTGGSPRLPIPHPRNPSHRNLHLRARGFQHPSRSDRSKVRRGQGPESPGGRCPHPRFYGPAFEGERVRGEDIYLECGGGRTHAVEWVTSRNMDEVEDGKVEVIGPDLDQITPPAQLPLAIVAEVAGDRCRRILSPSWSVRSII